MSLFDAVILPMRIRNHSQEWWVFFDKSCFAEMAVLREEVADETCFLIRKSLAIPQTMMSFWFSLNWHTIINKNNLYQKKKKKNRIIKLIKCFYKHFISIIYVAFNIQLHFSPFGLFALFAVLNLKAETNTTLEWQTYGKCPVRIILFSHMPTSITPFAYPQHSPTQHNSSQKPSPFPLRFTPTPISQKTKLKGCLQCSLGLCPLIFWKLLGPSQWKYIWKHRHTCDFPAPKRSFEH